ncbi:MAG: hypothetical protein IPG96_03930 [Proteobacteria bacterium]|nr:hypothetical protein [Pseudomonadota bacterium]
MNSENPNSEPRASQRPWPAAARLALTVTFLALPACGGDDLSVGDPVASDSSYLVESRFDVDGHFDDSGVGEALNMLRDVSDGTDDPGRFVVDQVVDRVPLPLKLAIKPLRPMLGRELNKVVYDNAPEIADGLKTAAGALSDAVRRFQVESRLDLGLDANGRLTGTHTIERVRYELAGLALTLTHAELGEEKLPAAVRVPVRRRGNELVIDAHHLKLPIGTALLLALERVGLAQAAGAKRFDTFGVMMVELFACKATAAALTAAIMIAGAAVTGHVGGGGAGSLETTLMEVCLERAQKLGDQLQSSLARIDEHSELVLVGSAALAEDGTSYAGKGWRGTYRLDKDLTAALSAPRNPFGLRRAEAATPTQ